MKIIIADDHNLVRQGIKSLLEKNENIKVIAEAADGHETIALVKQLQPDVLILDIAMPHLSGLQVISELCGAKIRTAIVVLTMYSDALTVKEAIRKGAKGYLLKDSIIEELIIAINAAIRGQIYLSPAITGIFVGKNPLIESDDEVKANSLSLREREVLQLISEGYSNNDIGKRLEISYKTVEKHRTNIMNKLKVHSTAKLVREAVKNGLVS